jgi:hypothetical protein
MSSVSVCPSVVFANGLNDIRNFSFPRGVATKDYTPDPSTKKIPISSLQIYIAGLQKQGLIPNYPIIDPGTGKINISAQVNADANFLAKVQQEYCAYQQRYDFALEKFLTLSVSINTTDNEQAQEWLPIAEELNLKLKSILEILSLLNSSRVKDLTNTLRPKIDALNSQIDTTSNTIQQQYSLLTKNNAVIETQNQMMVYTKEKNEHVLNQIALFTILNAFVIGGIFTLWRLG